MEYPIFQHSVRIEVSEADPIDFPTMLDEFEKQVIQGTLEICGGVKARAAEALGIKRTTLVEKMRRYGILFPNS